MNVYNYPIFQFLEGSGKSFIIPVYQRDYAWTRINCQKLWDDLIELNNNARFDHFLGTIVTIGSGYQEYIVIDGQQRLTTISILLVALHKFLKDKQNKTDDENRLCEQILDFLINKYSSEQDKRIRLKPNKQDKEFFENLFTEQLPSNINSNIVNNFNFFYDKLRLGFLAPQQIFNAFLKLKIVLIDLVRGQDDPQLIFESLNSTGVDLTAGDLIRNYILMDLQPSEQEKMYKTYWIDIEKLTGNVAEFIRNYLIYKIKIWVKKDDVYTTFKKVSIDYFKKDKKAILQELLDFANIYSWFVQINNHPNQSINYQLNRIYKLEFTVCHPFLLDVFDDLKSKIIDDETVNNILIILESYAFRKILVDNTTQGLNKMFITLSKEIKKESTWKDQYLDILNYILIQKRVSLRFPKDEEFEASLINKEVYKLQTKNRNFLLESLENYKSAYKINVDELTIEHIMPQTLTKDWKNKLGENWEEIHKKYLHTLGNLSLTAKNSELSNSTFEEKQRIDFQTSKLKLNIALDKLSNWGENEIIERAIDLIKDAKKIWPYPITKYMKEIVEEQIFDLTSEDSFTGSKPLYLYFEDDEKGLELKSWKDLLAKTCKFLYNYSPTEFTAIQNSPEFQWHFNINKPFLSSLEFLPNKFVEGTMSTNSILLFLAKLCERINFPPEKIQFSIKN
ncbi:MAG: DUF262 domain-containing protein [Leptospiraceae bacterium]|nr:DUF262 domain-containing protein [Leptospiraceae bacterium]